LHQPARSEKSGHGLDCLSLRALGSGYSKKPALGCQGMMPKKHKTLQGAAHPSSEIRHERFLMMIPGNPRIMPF
jgi:hypothetical protein